MPRILIVASTLPASDTDPVPAFVKDQAEWLKRLYPRLELSVLAPHDARSHTATLTHRAAYDEYRFHYFWPFRFEQLAGRGIMPTLKQQPLYYLIVPFLFLGEFVALLRLARRLRPDLLYAHWFTPQGITTGMVSALLGIPFVYTSHSSDVMLLHKLPFIGPRMVRRFTTSAQAVTVVSRRSLDKLRSFFDEQSWQRVQPRVHVIPMGAELSLGDKKISRSTSRPPERLVFVGRLVEKKGVQYLLPAFATFVKNHPTATLTIVGDGPWLKTLQQQATELGLGNKQVIWLGYVRGKKRDAAILAADMLVAPSIITAEGDAEGLPLTIMEGLIAGKICIATNESGADDIITDGKDGYLIPQQDTAALVAALEKAHALPLASRKAMQQQAHRLADQFAWKRIAKQHYDVLFKDLGA